MESMAYHRQTGKLHGIMYLQRVAGLFLKDFFVRVPVNDRAMYSFTGPQERLPMADSPRVVLTIAGFDPSAGAGVTADTKTIAAHGCYGIACVTAVTVQSTAGVRRVEPLDPGIITEMLNELAVLGSATVANAVADFLTDAGAPRFPNLILDPVLRSTSGAVLLDPKGTKVLKEKLIPIASVITPNADEAEILTGLQVQDLEGMKAAAARLHGMGSAAVIITGGHLEKTIDLLSFKSGIEHEVFRADRLQSKSTHGTGCAFSTAIACHLALGRGLAEATLLAKTYVRAAISSAQPLGRGMGPLHHLYRREERRRAAASGEEA
jgi:hydroxymethylpyrimidine/phosphomethylpyrimidine kinase